MLAFLRASSPSLPARVVEAHAARRGVPLLQLEERPPLAAANLERRAAAEDAVEERHGRDADVVGKRGQAARGGDAGAIRHPPKRREEELRSGKEVADELRRCEVV